LQLLRMTTAIGLLAAAATASAIAADVSGAGATFPYPIYAKWADAYKKETGITVNYQSVGSGEGIKQIQNKDVTFGASDMPLAEGDLDMHGLVQFPIADRSPPSSGLSASALGGTKASPPPSPASRAPLATSNTPMPSRISSPPPS
jgi:hypothetical protein